MGKVTVCVRLGSVCLNHFFVFFKKEGSHCTLLYAMFLCCVECTDCHIRGDNVSKYGLCSSGVNVSPETQTLEDNL